MLLLGAVTVVAAVLRAIALDNGLWYDEIVTLVDFARKPLAQILTEYGKNNHPLNSVLTHASLAAFGDHPWSLRLPAVLFGIACIPMVYALGAVIGSAREGLLAACVLTVSYHHVWFSQNARGYTALAFWALLSSLLLLRGLRGAHARWFIAYGVVAALGIYTHLAMGFVILAHLLGWLWLIVRGTTAIPGRNGRRAAIGFALAGIGTVLLYAPMVVQTYVAFRAPTPLQEIATPRWAVREALHVLATGFGSWGALVSLALFGIGLRDYWRRPWLVATLVVLPAVLTAVGLVALKQPIHPRFFFFLICFGALIVVRGAILAGSWISETARVTRRLGGPAIGTILVGVVILANALSLGSLYRHPKQDYEGALRYVEARRGVGDTVVTAGLAAVRPYREYYGKPWEIVQTPEDVERVRSTARQVWVVYALPRYMDPELMAWMRRECRATEVFPGTLSGGEVVVCAL